MKTIKLMLLVIVIVIGSSSAVSATSPKAVGERVFEYHSDTAILLFPIYLPLIAFKFTFYDFPKAGISMPWELGKKLFHPSYTEIESLIKGLNDPDITEKQFVIYRLKYITGQSFGYPGPLTKDQEKKAIHQWNQWWKEQPPKPAK